MKYLMLIYGNQEKWDTIAPGTGPPPSQLRPAS
jgi:hypothetical protein